MGKDQEPRQTRLVSLQEAIGTVIHEERWGDYKSLSPEERRAGEYIKMVAFEEAYREIIKGRK